MSFVVTCEAERVYFHLENWILCRKTFEFIHEPSGLSMYDLYQFVEHYEAGMKIHEYDQSMHRQTDGS